MWEIQCTEGSQHAEPMRVQEMKVFHQLYRELASSDEFCACLPFNSLRSAQCRTWKQRKNYKKVSF